MGAANGVCCTSSSAVGVANPTAVGDMICKVSIIVGNGVEFDLGLWWLQVLHKKVLKCSGIRLVDMALW